MFLCTWTMKGNWRECLYLIFDEHTSLYCNTFLTIIDDWDIGTIAGCVLTASKRNEAENKKALTIRVTLLRKIYLRMRTPMCLFMMTDDHNPGLRKILLLMIWISWCQSAEFLFPTCCWCWLSITEARREWAEWADTNKPVRTRSPHNSRQCDDGNSTPVLTQTNLHNFM